MHILCRENRLAVRDVEILLNPFFLTHLTASFSFHIKVMTTTSYATKHKSEHRMSRMYPALTLLTPHSHPTRTYRQLIQLASHKLFKQSEICAISISAKSFFQKKFSPLVSPISSECIYFCFILDIFFPLHFFVLCCSTFISHFACIKEDTMREKKSSSTELMSRAGSGAPPSLQLDTKRQIKNLKLKHV